MHVILVPVLIALGRYQAAETIGGKQSTMLRVSERCSGHLWNSWCKGICEDDMQTFKIIIDMYGGREDCPAGTDSDASSVCSVKLMDAIKCGNHCVASTCFHEPPQAQKTGTICLQKLE